MVAYSRHLYHCLLAELRQHHRGGLGLQRRIEAGFGSCYHYWSEVAVRAADHRFLSVGEEIEFFRQIKPRFVSLIDYYQLIYHAFLFVPDLGPARVREFWRRESERLPAFLQSHAAFALYYASGRRDLDLLYFTRISLPGEEPRSAFDALVSRLLALRRYQGYVLRRSEELANGDEQP